MLTIRYNDGQIKAEATCDEVQEKVIRHLCEEIAPKEYSHIYIDLSSDIEEVSFWQHGHRNISCGGAIAWNIYRAVATIWPKINQHTAGPPSPPERG